jgi:H+/Cl- antiporter ClcA
MEEYMKWLLNILGIILILIGVIWLLQGINILPGSFMSGQPLYAVLGVIVGAIGTLLLFLNNRRHRAGRDTDHSQMEH